MEMFHFPTGFVEGKDNPIVHLYCPDKGANYFIDHPLETHAHGIVSSGSSLTRVPTYKVETRTMIFFFFFFR